MLIKDVCGAIGEIDEESNINRQAPSSDITLPQLGANVVQNMTPIPQGSKQAPSIIKHWEISTVASSTFYSDHLHQKNAPDDFESCTGDIASSALKEDQPFYQDGTEEVKKGLFQTTKQPMKQGLSKY